MTRSSLATLMVLPLFVSVALTACKKEEGAANSNAPKKVLATYAGGELTEEDINREVLKLMQEGADGRKITYESLDPRMKQAIIKNAIAQRLVVAEAKKVGVDQDADVKKKLDAVANRVIAQEFALRKTKELVSDTQIRAFYDKEVASVAQKEEFRASHILVKSEEEAKAILEQLKQDSSKFAELARTKSIDATRVRGGNLGYFLPDRMVPEFSAAVKNMKVGEIAGPVKTDFGWHVIYLQDRRPAVPLAFDKAKVNIENKLRQDALSKYIDNLIGKASIVYVDPAAASVEKAVEEQKAKTTGKQSVEAPAETPKEATAATAAATPAAQPAEKK